MSHTPFHHRPAVVGGLSGGPQRAGKGPANLENQPPLLFRDEGGLTKTPSESIPRQLPGSIRASVSSRVRPWRRGGPPRGNKLSRKKNGISINFRRSARISWIGAGPPSLAHGARQGRRRRRRQGCPAPIQEIRADLKKFIIFVAFVFSSSTDVKPT